MLAGINTLQAESLNSSNEEHYLFRILDTIRGAQDNTRFVLFTHEGNHDRYEGWMRVRVKPYGRGGLGWSNGDPGFAAAVRQAKVDVLLSLLEAAPVNSPVPTVLYTLGLSAWQDELNKSGSAVKAAKRACAQARAILLPSEFMRRKCLELFESPLDKSIVAHPGVDAGLDTRQPSLLNAPYFMSFLDSATTAHLSEACADLKKRNNDFPYPLIIAGPPSDTEPLSWGENIIRVETYTPQVLASLYQHSAAFLYPAKYDGSGMRVIEALRAGATVVTPTGNAANELAGDIPFFYNPASAASMGQAIRWAIEQTPAQRKQRIQQGRTLAGKYSWEKTAWKLLAALKR
ncbi:MAG TPA: glycosyltransferase [Candidatus Hydrogenedentes bacterium]|nr:glycosyltransferase [Candidatus Hydrogenedentota bacterium]